MDVKNLIELVSKMPDESLYGHECDELYEKLSTCSTIKSLLSHNIPNIRKRITELKQLLRVDVRSIDYSVICALIDIEKVDDNLDFI